MAEQANLGAVLAVAVGGLFHGSWALPMKRITKWQWENIWLVYSVAALIVIPALLAWSTVPALGTVYANTAASTLLLVALFGFGWGVGSTLFGLGIARVGMALGFALILGITSSVGSLLPLIVQNPAELFTRRGTILLAGLVIVVTGIIFCSLAGAQREKDLNPPTEGSKKSGFTTGLLICLASGFLSPSLNFGFVYGKPMQDAAVALGARVDLSANAIWVPALAGGFLPNAGYAIYLLMKNKTWDRFGKTGAPAWYWLGATLMGLLWFGGISIYGMGAAAMGRYGAVIGWPVFMSVVIITANILGVLTGEWKGASSRARTLSWIGIGILVVAISVIAQA